MRAPGQPHHSNRKPDKPHHEALRNFPDLLADPGAAFAGLRRRKLRAVEPPIIAVQPVSASALAGAGVTFSVAASGDGLSYQWQLSSDGGATWTSVAEAVTAAYAIAVVDATMNGHEYRVVVSGPNASATSSAATLTVTAAIDPPVISAQPASQSAVEGTHATFTVTATGTALSYQWQSSPNANAWTDISDATGATLTLTVALTNSGESIRVVVSNSAGNVPSSPATLTVTAAPTIPVITQQPLAASVAAPQTATFRVVATGTPVPSYQWQKSGDGGATYADISGATSASYSTPATSTSDSGTVFRVHVSNSAGDVFSAGVLLDVSPAPAPPVITLQPVGQSVAAPVSATFSVTVTGTPTPTYQWQLSTDGGATFANINGATSRTYTTAATSVGDNAKQFRLVATNSSGTATSNAAMLAVTAGSLPGMATAKGVVIGAAALCALQPDATVSCWGLNSGQFGNGTGTPSFSPLPIPALRGATIETGSDALHSCEITGTGTVACWGNNADGELGDGTTVDRYAPTIVPGLSGIKAMGLGGTHTCAVKSDGTVACWGGNAYGQLGDGTTISRSSPVNVPGLSSVVAMTAGLYHTCALLSDGSVACWGQGGNGQLGDGTSLDRASPVSVIGLSSVNGLVAGGFHSCAVKSDGALFCWGRNGNGELGDGTTTNRGTATPVSGIVGARTVVASFHHTCVLIADGSMKCWGQNSFGALGDGTTTDRHLPTTVLGLSAVLLPVAGGNNSCAVRLDGTVACWGDNSGGELGIGAAGLLPPYGGPTKATTPTTVPGLIVVH